MMTEVSPMQGQASASSSDPLAGWENDDLLRTERARERVAASDPRAFHVLDWPALRDEFQRRDEKIKAAKNMVNQYGKWAARLGALGASLLALAPLVANSPAEHPLLVAGCAGVVFGSLMGLWHLVGHRDRARWLLGRLWAERLRQFYFQYLVNNFDAAVAAMAGDEALEAYRTARDKALTAFIAELDAQLSARGFSQAIQWMTDDIDDGRAWAMKDWQAPVTGRAATMTNDHRQLLACLDRQRIGIQELYALHNLKSGVRSAGEMARQLVSWGNVATLAFVLSLALAGVWALFLEAEHGRFWGDALISLSGIAAAWGLYFRMEDQGMRYSLDAERYELYVEQIKLVRKRFDDAADDAAAKVAALRQMELYSYHELRQFLAAHTGSRFLG